MERSIAKGPGTVTSASEGTIVRKRTWNGHFDFLGAVVHKRTWNGHFDFSTRGSSNLPLVALLLHLVAFIITSLRSCLGLVPAGLVRSSCCPSWLLASSVFLSGFVRLSFFNVSLSTLVWSNLFTFFAKFSVRIRPFLATQSVVQNGRSFLRFGLIRHVIGFPPSSLLH